ncbi:hypothetical protein [Bradyrhizobium sp. 62]|uniref:hypothetical protein n=1 Tax=Bradyrhizobium sp. 62 TaxID=1043588 RepID=UPI001FF8DE43|nr:hypothetical protein [Bradyrhizobium sp. 62]MCK1367244.1 hypothetical protein [Bradyrhizobium sp. 62]
MRVLLVAIVALLGGATAGYVVASFGGASAPTEASFPAPDPAPQFVKPPRAGQSYGCDPIADANVVDERFKRKAIVWTNQSPSKVAIQAAPDSKRVLLMRATDVSVGVAQPEEFTITSNTASYLTAEEHLTLGIAAIIFDVKTMKMVWSFNGQGMLGIKGESVLFQCR